MYKTLVRKAREVTINTPLDTLREIELALLDADSDDTDLCLPRVESCILYVIQCK